MKERIGIYDLDGCVVDSSARLKKYVDLEAKSRGDMTSYTHSFYWYGQTTEGDLPITKGILMVQTLAQLFNVQHLMAVTSRGASGREPTEAWLRHHLPWATGGEHLMMHRERHFGRGVDSLSYAMNKRSWGYEDNRVIPDPAEVTWEGDAWFVPFKGAHELFDAVAYKRAVLTKLRENFDVVFAVDDHPDICNMYQDEGVDTIHFQFGDTDCLTPAGDPRR
jgi:hypothetical protein